MALLTLTVNNLAPALDKKTQEVAVIARALGIAAQLVQSQGGLVTSGNILVDGGVNIGTWTYTPQASS
jgi:hypothetical protein